MGIDLLGVAADRGLSHPISQGQQAEPHRHIPSRGGLTAKEIHVGNMVGGFARIEDRTRLVEVQGLKRLTIGFGQMGILDDPIGAKKPCSDCRGRDSEDKDQRHCQPVSQCSLFLSFFQHSMM